MIDFNWKIESTTYKNMFDLTKLLNGVQPSGNQTEQNIKFVMGAEYTNHKQKELIGLTCHKISVSFILN